MYIRSSAHGQKPVAAIDIGSNSIHMVIARLDSSDHLVVIDSDKASVRLGQHLKPNGMLSAKGIQLAVETIVHMARLACAYNATIRAVATHTLREAKNQQIVLKAIQKRTGIHVEIVDGPEEARLVFLGMRYGLPLERETVLGMDIGGGSTEFIVAKADDIKFASSIKTGAVTFSKAFFGDNNPTNAAIKALHHEVNIRLEPLASGILDTDFHKAIASSGTAKALASIHCRLFYQRALKHENGYKLPSKDIAIIVKALEELKTPKRIKQTFGLDQARSQIILAGAAIMKEASRVLKVREWTITTFGLKEGIVVDTYRRLAGSRSDHSDDIRWRQIKLLSESWHIDTDYAQHVSDKALIIFDQLKDHMGHYFSEDHKHIWMIDRDILKIASWLHECGKFINHSSYHRHSYYLLNHCNLVGFTQDERHMIALVTLFHRKNHPRKDCDELKGLMAHEFERVSFLSGILRMATSLNRTRANASITMNINHRKLRRPSGVFSSFTMKFKLPSKSTQKEPARAGLHQLEREIPALEKSFHWRIQFDLKALQLTGVEKVTRRSNSSFVRWKKMESKPVKTALKKSSAKKKSHKRSGKRSTKKK